MAAVGRDESPPAVQSELACAERHSAEESATDHGRNGLKGMDCTISQWKEMESANIGNRESLDRHQIAFVFDSCRGHGDGQHHVHLSTTSRHPTTCEFL